MAIIGFLLFLCFFILFVLPISCVAGIGWLGATIYMKTNIITATIFCILAGASWLYGYLNYVIWLMEWWEKIGLLDKMI